MRQIEEVREKRRMGWSLREIIEELLSNSEELLNEYENPFEVLSKSGVKLQQKKADEWLDMTTESWLGLNVEKQIEYATAYQKWYAEEIGEPSEKEVKGGETSIVMNLIPPGKFWMGSLENEESRSSNEVRHKVLISEAFLCGKYEVTQREWNAVMGNYPSYFKGNELLPVESVSWEDCQEFCKKEGVKLLTEAQWEYACRAGTTTTFSFGDDEDKLDAYAWHRGNSSSGPQNVGIREPNGWGIHDMHGNVWEWCEDWYSVGSIRVYRGGGWFDDCASAVRDGGEPSYHDSNIGFRTMRSYP